MNTHDFPTDAVAQVIPYGVSDPGSNCGPVVVGTSGNTADLAIGAVRDWWRQKGRRPYPCGHGTDGRGRRRGEQRGHGPRLKFRLHEFAGETGLAVTMCHYPPGTSDWNPIEHRLFSQITATWAGIVLTTVAVLVGLIRRTATGLRVTARVMPKKCPTGWKVTAAEFEAIKLTRPRTCPQRNCTTHTRAGGKNS